MGSEAGIPGARQLGTDRFLLQAYRNLGDLVSSPQTRTASP